MTSRLCLPTKRFVVHQIRLGSEPNDLKVLGLLHKLWSNLPDTAKREIEPGIAKRKIRDRQENDPPKKARRFRRSLDTEFKLCPDLMANVPIWIEDPLSFFSEGESRLELKSSPLDGMNAYMNKLSERTTPTTSQGDVLSPVRMGGMDSFTPRTY
jgi:hypothetical protein